MTVVILFVFGAIVGSFLNVWALRLNSGISLGGRSHCPSCGHKLGALELVPVLSYLLLRGRCRSCRPRIPLQYFLVEVVTGLVFVSVPAIFLPVFALFIVIAIYDLRHKIIPDSIVYSAIALSVIIRIYIGGTLWDFLAGPVLFAFLAAIWFFSRGRAIGFGDAKLSLAIGLLLRVARGSSAIVLSFWIGAAFGVLLIIFSHFPTLFGRHKKITIKTEIPFAPFLILGAWLGAIFQLNLLHVPLF